MKASQYPDEAILRIMGVNADGELKASSGVPEHSHTEFLTEAEVTALVNTIVSGLTGIGGQLPIGCIAYFYALPNGWYEPNGQAISATSNLGVWCISTLGIAENGDGTVNMPDWTDRFVVSRGSIHALNSTGGANTVTLVESELASHIGHLTADGTNRGAWVQSGGNYYCPALNIYPAVSRGSNEPHENRPPYISLIMGVYGG